MADLPTQKKLHMGLDDICKQRNAKKEQPARARPQGRNMNGGGQRQEHPGQQHQRKRNAAHAPDQEVDNKRHRHQGQQHGQGRNAGQTHQQQHQQQRNRQHQTSFHVSPGKQPTRHAHARNNRQTQAHHAGQQGRSAGHQTYPHAQARAPIVFNPSAVVYEDDYTYMEGSYCSDDGTDLYNAAGFDAFGNGFNYPGGLGGAGQDLGAYDNSMYGLAGRNINMPLDDIILSRRAATHSLDAANGMLPHRSFGNMGSEQLRPPREHVRSASEERDFRAGYHADYLGADSPPRPAPQQDTRRGGSTAAAARPSSSRRVEEAMQLADIQPSGSQRYRQEQHQDCTARSSQPAPRRRDSPEARPVAARSSKPAPASAAADRSQPRHTAQADRAAAGADRQPVLAGGAGATAKGATGNTQRTPVPAPRSGGRSTTAGTVNAAAVAPKSAAGGSSRANASQKPAEPRQRAPVAAPATVKDENDDEEYSPDFDDDEPKAGDKDRGTGRGGLADPRRGTTARRPSAQQEQGEVFEDGGFIAPPTMFREGREAGDDLFSLKTVIRPNAGVVERVNISLEDVAAAVLGINSVLTRDALAVSEPPVVLSLRVMLKLKDRMELGELPAAADMLAGKQPHQQAVLMLSGRLVQMASRAREMVNMLEYGRDIKDSNDQFRRQYDFILHQLKHQLDWGEIFEEVPQFYSLSRADQQTVLENLQRRRELRAAEAAAAAAAAAAAGMAAGQAAGGQQLAAGK